jgi:DNA-binding transcriptional ArsR family regulator
MKETESPTGLDIELLEKISHRMNLIAHPTRIAIIELLQEKEKLSVTQIHKHLNIEQAVCSNHLRLLKQSGALTSKRDGKKIIYSVNTKAFKSIMDTVAKCNAA